MSKKIGRNAPCPCGSGKKYKKCCINKKNVDFEKDNHLSQFNRDFLINCFSGASLLPQNHGKNVRLEKLLRESLVYGKVDSGSTNLRELRNVLDKHYAHESYEDPPINLFTDLITFFGGDYLVLPGISDGGLFTLSKILDSVYHLDNKLPHDFKTLTYQTSLLILNISDSILSEIGLERYNASNVETDYIELLDNKDLALYSAAIYLSDQSINRLCENLNIEKQLIELFLINDETDLKESDLNLNPVLAKPILKTENGYLVLSTSCLHIALLHNIVEFAIKYDCLNEVTNLSATAIWHNCNQHLLYSKYEILDEYSKAGCPTLQEFEVVYKFDKDKIAFVYLDYDKGENYDTQHPFKSVGTNDNSKKKAYIKSVLECLRQNFPDYKILELALYAGIGRHYQLLYKYSELSNLLAFPAAHFEVIMKNREYDSLELWNFSKAKKNLLSKTMLNPYVDNLSLYSIYKDKRDSFYFNDERVPDFMVIDLGYPKKFIEESVQDEDLHSIGRLDEKGNYYNVPCLKINKDSSIYISPSDLGRDLTQVVEGYKQPIWIKYKGELPDNGSHLGIYIEFIEAISYWIWQITKLLSPFTDSLSSKPITILFEFKDKNNFHEISHDLTRKENIELDFEVSLGENSIETSIPSTILPYLYGKDNLGEQILVKKLLEGFALFIDKEKGDKKLTKTQIDDIINKVVAIPFKKKVFLLNTDDDLTLDNRGIEKPRYVQKYNTEEFLDNLLDNLLKENIIQKGTTTISNQADFIKKMTAKVFLPLLNKKVRSFDRDFLIKYLFKQNESLINKRNHLILNSPSRIACFVSREEQVKDLSEKFSDIDRTTLTTRCLIEHILVCKPDPVTSTPSQEELDDLMVLMDQIVVWGMLGDALTYELFEINIDVLPSGRIGRDRNLEDKVYKPYRILKTSEDISDSVLHFENHYSSNDEIDSEGISKPVEIAFEKEYGMNLTLLLQFLHSLSFIGFKFNPSCTILEEGKLKEEIRNIIPSISDNELSIGLDLFSLKERKSVFDIPKGYEKYDGSPWRFNRKLSLMAKPLLKIKSEGLVEYYFSPRQVIRSGKNLVNLFYSGRLRVKEGGALSKLIGKELEKKGSAFTNEVYNFFKSKHPEIVIDKEVRINSKSRLKSTIDKGDVDIILISSKLKKIFLIECKNTAAARNMKELVIEVNRLFGSDSKKGWIKKHEERHEWVKSNLPLVSQLYNMDLKNYNVVSVVLTSEQLISELLKKDVLPFNMISFYSIQENGINALND